MSQEGMRNYKVGINLMCDKIWQVYIQAKLEQEAIKYILTYIFTYLLSIHWIDLAIFTTGH